VGGEGDEGIRNRVGILTVPKRNYQNPHPRANLKIMIKNMVYFSSARSPYTSANDQNPHPGDTPPSSGLDIDRSINKKPYMCPRVLCWDMVPGKISIISLYKNRRLGVF